MSEKQKIIPSEYAKKAAQAHSTLGQFGSIVSLLEGNNIYGKSAQATSEKIIILCRAEMQRQLTIYNEEMDYVR